MYEDMFEGDDIPYKIKYFEVVFEGSGITINLEMIKESSCFRIHEVRSYEIKEIEDL